MTKQIAAFVALVMVFAAGWFFIQGPGNDMLHHGAATTQGPAVPNAVDTGNPVPQLQAETAPPVQVKPAPNSLESIQANGVVRISNENPSEPFFGVAGGAAHGFNVDFAKLIFADSSFTSAAHPVITLDTNHSVSEYADVPKQLLAKTDGNYTVDIAMDGLTFPNETPAGVVYTVPYIDDFGYALIVGKGSAIKSADDLKGKTVGVLKGDPDVKAFVQRQFPGTRIEEVSDADANFIADTVDGHKVDAFIYDYPFAVSSIKGTDLQFAVTRLDGADLAYKIGVRDTDKNLLVYLNAAIAQARNNPDYKQLLLKYFTSAQTVTAPVISGELTYTVKPRDTLSAIATSTGADWRAVQRRNNLPNPNLIQVGQTLVIPKK
jgi:ABC-type amino acid transport substrate-binding protein